MFSLAFSPAGDTLAVGGTKRMTPREGLGVILMLRTGSLDQVWRQDDGMPFRALWSLAFSPSGDALAAAGSPTWNNGDGVRVLHAGSGEVKCRLTGSVVALAYHVQRADAPAAPIPATAMDQDLHGDADEHHSGARCDPVVVDE